MKTTSKTLKKEFAAWLEMEAELDSFIALVQPKNILKKLDNHLGVINAGRMEKIYLYNWIKCFRWDRELDNYKSYL